MTFPSVKTTDNDHILRKDDRSFLNALGMEGIFISTPGHSPDSWSLVLSDGRAFCADAAMNFLIALAADYRPIFITDERQTYESRSKLLSFGSKTFYTGHGPPFDKMRIEECLQRYHKR